MNDTSIDYDATSGAFTGITTNLTKIDFDDCNLTSTQVDNALADCVASGISDTATIEIAGNNAAPSGQGLAYVDLLVSRGYTVTHTASTSAYIGMDALNNSTIDPRFDFLSGTVIPYIDGVAGTALTSGVEGSIVVTDNQRICYVYSSPANVTAMYLYFDSIDGNISGWTLPASLTQFFVNATSVSGDISGWTLPASLQYFYVDNTSLSGDISGWTLPASLVTFYVYSTSVSGDIGSGWTLPASLSTFRVNSTSLSGDISGWTLPASLTHFYVYSTSLSGDISGWTLPASLVDFYVSTTAVDYDATSGAFTGITTGLTKIDFDNCSLTETQVDNALADCVASGISDTATIEIAGNNAAPSGQGLAYVDILVSRGYTVTHTASTAGYIGMDALGNSTIDPSFTFSSGTVIPYIDGVAGTALTSGVEGSIVVTDNQRICYVYSSPANVTRIYLHDDSIDGNISGWTLPASLTQFLLHSTSVSGDISGWTLPASLTHFDVSSTSVSGDISGWTLPASLVAFWVNDTSIDYDATSGAFTGITTNLTKIDFDDCNLTSTQVDNALADCVASGISDTATIEIAGNNAAPSGQGLAYVDILESRGYTVTYTSSTPDFIGMDAVGDTTLTPVFTFSSGAVTPYVDGVAKTALTTATAGSVVVTNNQRVTYVMSVPANVTGIDINGDAVDGDISGWAIPVNLASFLINSTSLNYDATGAGKCFTRVTAAFGTINFSDCALTTTQVNNVLADCLIANIDDAITLELAGTNAAPTNLTDHDALEVLNWTVNVTAP